MRDSVPKATSRQQPGWEEGQDSGLWAKLLVDLASTGSRHSPGQGLLGLATGPGQQTLSIFARGMPGTDLSLSYFNAGYFLPDCSVLHMSEI